jgi:ketosteroid isomerase-like protein
MRCFAWLFTIVPFVIVSATETATAQTITPSMVESQMNTWLAAWASNDPEVIARVDPPSNGFGARALQLRPAEMSLSTWLDQIKAFFATKEYYRAEFNELHTAVDGDIGLAWGFYTEDFKDKGRTPEKLRIRFTTTMKYEPNGWRTLLYHRDIQQFDERGRYLRSP